MPFQRINPFEASEGFREIRFETRCFGGLGFMGKLQTGKRMRRYVQRHFRKWQSIFSGSSDAGEIRGRDTQGDRPDKKAWLALMTREDNSSLSQFSEDTLTPI